MSELKVTAVTHVGTEFYLGTRTKSQLASRSTLVSSGSATTSCPSGFVRQHASKVNCVDEGALTLRGSKFETSHNHSMAAVEIHNPMAIRSRES